MIKGFIENDLGLAFSGEVESILGGHLNEAYRVTTNLGELFIRSRQKGTLWESSDIDTEFLVHSALYDAGAPLAKPIGRNEKFIALQWLEGESNPHRLQALIEEKDKGAEILYSIGVALAKIHLVKLDTNIGIRAFPLAERWNVFEHILDQMPGHYPVLEWAIRQLAYRMPEPIAPVLAHRDFRVGNMLIDTGTLSLKGIVDWEFAGLSDPYEDIGWFCARCWRYGNVAKEAGGLGPREAFYNGYETVTKQKLDHTRARYWENFAALRWAIIALQQGERHRKGLIRNIDLALTPLRALEASYDLLMDIDDASFS